MEELRDSTILSFVTFYRELAIYWAALWRTRNRVVGRVLGGELDLATVQENLAVADDPDLYGARLLPHVS
jgi:uncharacterized membrane protein